MAAKVPLHFAEIPPRSRRLTNVSPAKVGRRKPRERREMLLLNIRWGNRIARSLMGGVAVILSIALWTVARQVSALSANGTNGNLPSPSSPRTAACVASPYREFDFWIGDWDVFESGTPRPVAHVRVTRILGGCVLQEDYEEPGGARGESFSIYDASRRVWHQTWVTNGGKLLVIEGKFGPHGMVLSGVDHARGQALVRGTWKRTSGGGVRETAVRSSDGGETWKPWFDLYFRPRGTPP
jgi:hypothetical protein